MRVASWRGVILEELVLYLLVQMGYRIVTADEEGARLGHSGLEVQGRGEWHQIDALAASDKTPAFMFPLRLMVEAKCYKANIPVGIETVRNCLGVQKDISENYFAIVPSDSTLDPVKAVRYNYYAALFSTSGYTAGAQRFAIAHQIFLIQYQKLGLLEPVIVALLALDQRHFTQKALSSGGKPASDLRTQLRQLLDTETGRRDRESGGILSREGLQHLERNILGPLHSIRGSYFGMLQGKWPLHLLSRQPLPPEAFAGTDEVLCKIYGRESDRWSFIPAYIDQGEPGWFRLEFDLPTEVAEYVRTIKPDPIAVAQAKYDYFSSLDLTGKIGGVMRQIRLQLDEDWLADYVSRRAGK